MAGSGATPPARRVVAKVSIPPHPAVRPAALNAGFPADSGRSSLRGQAAGLDPYEPFVAASAGDGWSRKQSFALIVECPDVDSTSPASQHMLAAILQATKKQCLYLGRRCLDGVDQGVADNERRTEGAGQAL